ncbi:hypothetical protein [Streptomyces sp. MUSC 125]|uniref:hypothetical protein n=1 Tax=Streptomyces sp. MUSC 125 TaxID=1428624 RepID=UPI001F1E088F|nr:hypothetical protein [Streptomyces sp. MUSC 125]
MAERGPGPGEELSGREHDRVLGPKRRTYACATRRISSSASSKRKRRLKLPDTWPWADVIIRAFRRILALPHPI